MASGTYVFRSILNLGVTVFTPTVALNTIIGVPIWISLLAITVISIGFNCLGGLRAAVTADIIQVENYKLFKCQKPFSNFKLS